MFRAVMLGRLADTVRNTAPSMLCMSPKFKDIRPVQCVSRVTIESFDACVEKWCAMLRQVRAGHAE